MLLFLPYIKFCIKCCLIYILVPIPHWRGGNGSGPFFPTNSTFIINRERSGAVSGENPIDKLSFKPAVEEQPRSNEAFEPENEEEEQITPECSYDRDQDKCDDLNVSPLEITVMTKPEDQQLTEEIGRLTPADTKEMNNSFAGKIPKAKTKEILSPNLNYWTL